MQRCMWWKYMNLSDFVQYKKCGVKLKAHKQLSKPPAFKQFIIQIYTCRRWVLFVSFLLVLLRTFVVLPKARTECIFTTYILHRMSKPLTYTNETAKVSKEFLRRIFEVEKENSCDCLLRQFIYWDNIRLSIIIRDNLFMRLSWFIWYC